MAFRKKWFGITVDISRADAPRVPLTPTDGTLTDVRAMFIKPDDDEALGWLDYIRIEFGALGARNSVDPSVVKVEVVTNNNTNGEGGQSHSLAVDKDGDATTKHYT